MLKIGLVTVTYNSSIVLEDFMKSMLSQNFLNWQLYLVDSDSQDGTLEKLKFYSDDRIIILPQPENVGFAKGSNIGICRAIENECDYIVLINNDTIFDGNLLQSMLERIVALQVEMVAPKMFFYEPRNMIWSAGGGFNFKPLEINYHLGDRQYDNDQYDKLKQVDFAPMCCIMFRKEVFLQEHVGLLDETYFTYFEDADWFWRAKQLGKILMYIPDACLWHKVSSLANAESDFAYRYILRNRIYFVRKNFRGARKVYTLLYLLIYFGVGGAVKFMLKKWSMNKLSMVYSSLYHGFLLKSDHK